VAFATPQDLGASQYAFTGWMDGVTTASRTVTASSAVATYTANFQVTATIAVPQVQGQIGQSVNLHAAVGPAGAVFSGSVQFQVDGVNAGSPVAVNHAGTYSSAYVIGLSAGAHTILATLTSTAPPVAGISANNTLTVKRESQTIAFNTIPSQVVGAPVALGASASSGLPVSFASLTPSVCTVSGATATMAGAGTCTIQASQPGNATYAAAPPVSQSFTVSTSASFTIKPIPAAETVYRGVLAGFILQLQSVNHFNGNVTLSCAGGPPGSQCLDLPQTVKVNGTAYAVSGILFPKNSTPGIYTITFTGVSGSLTETATATFTVK
jgi:hypothetical protein